MSRNPLDQALNWIAVAVFSLLALAATFALLAMIRLELAAVSLVRAVKARQAERQYR